MEVLPPLEVVEMLRHVAAGQELFCIVVSGPDTDESERIALDWFAGYGREASTPIECDGSIILTSKVDGDLACVLSNMDSSYYDDLITAGLLSKDAPSCSAFAAACVESYQRNLGGILGFCREVDGYEICGVAGYATACEILLRYLAKQPKTENELPADPTYEQQTCKKSTRRNGKKQSKHDVFLNRVEKWRFDKCKKDPQYLEAVNRDAFITQYMVVNLYALTGPQLNQEINFMLADCSEEQLQKSISITNSTSSIYASWSKHRAGSGRKAGTGGSSNIERDLQAATVCQAGLRNGKPDGGKLTAAQNWKQKQEDDFKGFLDNMISESENL